MFSFSITLCQIYPIFLNYFCVWLVKFNIAICHYQKQFTTFIKNFCYDMTPDRFVGSFRMRNVINYFIIFKADFIYTTTKSI